MRSFRIKTSTASDTCVLAVAGEVDLDAAPEIVELSLAALDDPTCRGLIIDLDAVTFIDSTGLGALVRIHNEAARLGKDLTLTRLPDRVSTLLHLTGLETTLAPH
jgi:anti-sigma B factor antagonist